MNTTQFDPAKPFTTRAGFPARLLASDGRSESSYGTPTPLVVEYQTNHGIWYTDCFHSDGRCRTKEPSLHDLINVPEPKPSIDIWVNVYSGKCPPIPYYSKFDADSTQQPGRIACLHIVREFEPGEGLLFPNFLK